MQLMTSSMQRCLASAFILILVHPCFAQREFASRSGEGELPVTLRYRTETSAGSGRFHTVTRRENWMPAQTAIIVCDMWDYHHCLNAVRRLEEFAPRLNEVLVSARERGVTIIHAPSSCMNAYADHPARRRALITPSSSSQPVDIGAWCDRIASEEQGVYPIDQSDGGEDDDPAEHEEWAAKLASMGRNPRAPWQRQTELLTIDEDRDYITDSGGEVWNILESQGIENVVLAGVHTNMCVLGRPFGLRQMAKNNKHVVLMRDMTDTMYNPQMAPFVDHHTGTDLIVEHIEKYVCPTMTSDQWIGGKQFRFKSDRRPHLVILIGENEYKTNHTLPEFAARHLGKDFRVSFVFDNDVDRNDFPGLDVVTEAELLVLSVRRRVLKPFQMELLQRFVHMGKPVVGIRTASHAFVLREPPPNGLFDWPEFDAQVFGGSYSGHYGNDRAATIHAVDQASDHPVMKGLPAESFAAGGSLYKTSPIADSAVPLLRGTVAGEPSEPVAWTFQRDDGGRSFYTSLGHPADFESPVFVRLLVNAIYDGAGLPIPRESPASDSGH